MEWPVRHDVAAGKIIGASASGRPRGKGLRLCDRLRGIEGARIVVASSARTGRPRAPSFLGQEPIVHIPAGAATSSRTSKTRILGGEKAPATLGRAAAPLKSRAALTRRGAPGRAVGLGQSVQPCGATVGLAQLSQDQREQNSGDESDQRDSEFRIHRWLPAR